MTYTPDQVRDMVNYVMACKNVNWPVYWTFIRIVAFHARTTPLYVEQWMEGNSD